MSRGLNQAKEDFDSVTFTLIVEEAGVVEGPFWESFELDLAASGRIRSRVVANQIETLKLQVATGIIRSRATTPTDNPALLDSIKGSKFRGEPPSGSPVNTRAGRRPSTYAAVEPSTNRPNRDGLVEA
ncbi:uncharacterized protein LOC119769034 [Culex quinquefasciatus]|uniref:uncharacterized protein LOC119769034 n=1 Tax=Culex quinquefasciatus TaxID=7176 RepID=UPI0018E31692|nr:uncharacterized protein LOC119769034 [Culex quinquefasciatus]